MDSKKMIWIGAIAGSTIGGLVPGLWHADAFSLSSIVFSTLGGVLGIWAGYRVGRMM